MTFKQFKKEFPEGIKITCTLDDVHITDAVVAYDSIGGTEYANILQNDHESYNDFNGKSYKYKYDYAIYSSEENKDVIKEFNINKVTNKPMKKDNKKSYTTKVTVEKTVKYRLPKYEVGKPIHVDFQERNGRDRQHRVTILPIMAIWDYDSNDVVYKYPEGSSTGSISELYINENLIK